MNRRHFLHTSLGSLAVAAGGFAMLRSPAAVPVAVPAPIVEGNTAFALDLYAKLRTKQGNVFYSPYSISAALSMTSAGAAGETLAEMTRVLHLPADQSAAHAGFDALRQQLLAGAARGDYQLNIANALWGQQGFPFRPEFLTLTQKHYGAGLQQVDFHNAERARQTINRWVEQQTKDKIKDLFPSGSIDASTRLVLANAIYFKGTWASQFQPNATSDAPFKANGSSKKVPTMHQKEHFGYAEGEDWQALEMRYAKSTLAMNLILPRAVDGLPALEGKLTTSALGEKLQALKSEEVIVSLPRFKATLGFDLTRTLAEMGMPKAFSPAADFSRMSSGDRLMISVVVHKAFVDVNEQGTEAAAATGVGVKLAAAPIRQEPKVFNADHPLLVLIRDTATGSILFLGRVTNPAS
jgi:serpin B